MVIRQDMVNENDEPRASPVKVQEGVAGGELTGGSVALRRVAVESYRLRLRAISFAM